MPTLSMEMIDQGSLDNSSIETKPQTKSFNSEFSTNIEPKSGQYGEIQPPINTINKYFDDLEAFLADPKHIQGSDATKHGTIAEHYEEAFRNAESVARGEKPSAELGKPNGAVDIYIDGMPAQMKYCQNTEASLRAQLENLGKGSDYLKIGKEGSLIIPKDQYRIVQQIQDHIDAGGKLATLNITENGQTIKLSRLERIYKNMQNIEIETGRKSTDVIQPGKTTYSEVQLGTANKTLSKYKSGITSQAFSNIARTAHTEGLKSGLTAAALTAAVSTVDNTRKYMNGEITATEAIIDVAKDTGTAGALGYGSRFISSTVASATQQSSHALIRTLGNANVTAAVIAFGIDSYDEVVDYAQGNITGKELAVKLGSNVAGTAAGTVAGTVGQVAGAAVGGIVGSVAGPVGTVVGAKVGGFAGGMVGGMVGYAVATEAYATAVEVAKGGVEVVVEKAEAVAETAVEVAVVVADVAVAVADVAVDVAVTAAVNVTDGAVELKNKAVEMGQSVIDSVAENAPEALESVKTAMNDFASNLGVVFNW